MKFDKKYKIHSAAAREATRYTLNGVMFEKDDNGARLVATNGRILAVVPVEDEGDTPGMVSTDTLKEATKGRTNSRTEAVLRLPDEERALVQTKSGTIEQERPDHVRMPDYRSIVRGLKTDTGLQVTLSAEHLLALIEALGARSNELSGITLTFQRKGTDLDDSAPVHVRALGDDEAFGIIMPIG